MCLWSMFTRSYPLDPFGKQKLWNTTILNGRAAGAIYFWCSFRGRFWIFFLGSWFYAFLPLCFYAFPAFCFSCFSAFPAFCFSCFSAFHASLLLCFTCFFSFLLLCFLCFSAFVILCLSISTITLLLFLFFGHAFFAALLPAPLLPRFLPLLPLCFFLSFALFSPVCILNETLKTPKKI